MEFHVETSKKDLKEFIFLTYGKVTTGRKRDIQLRVFFSIFFMATFLLLFLKPITKGPVFLWYLGEFASIFGFISAFIPLIGRRTAERIRIKLMDKACQSATIFLDENGIRTKADDGGQDIYFGWKNINSLIISDNLYLFVSNVGIGIFFNKQYVKDCEEQLKEYIKTNVDEKKISYRKS